MSSNVDDGFRLPIFCSLYKAQIITRFLEKPESCFCVQKILKGNEMSLDLKTLFGARSTQYQMPVLIS